MARDPGRVHLQGPAVVELRIPAWVDLPVRRRAQGDLLLCTRLRKGRASLLAHRAMAGGVDREDPAGVLTQVLLDLCVGCQLRILARALGQEGRFAARAGSSWQTVEHAHEAAL
eukprot:2090472-Alexandrium_andersonii.AAC.1